MNRERHLLPDVLSFKWFARHGFTVRREKEWGRGKKGLCLHRSFFFHTAAAYDIQEWKERPLSALQSEDTPPQKHFAILLRHIAAQFFDLPLFGPQNSQPNSHFTDCLQQSQTHQTMPDTDALFLPVDRGAPPLATIALCLAPAVLHYEPAVYRDLVRLL